MPTASFSAHHCCDLITEACLASPTLPLPAHSGLALVILTVIFLLLASPTLSVQQPLPANSLGKIFCWVDGVIPNVKERTLGR